MIASKNPKPNRCRHCKERMPEELARHVIHSDCIDPFMAAQRVKKEQAEAKKKRAAAKVERAVTKARREKLKTIADLIREAQTNFNAYIRARDAQKPCICCGEPLGRGEVGGGYDCGHYRSTGSASHLRFNEANAHAQRKHCNRYRGGRAVDYRIGLIARIGLPAVEALESDNAVKKWDRETLIAIKAEYAAKLKALKASGE